MGSENTVDPIINNREKIYKGQNRVHDRIVGNFRGRKVSRIIFLRISAIAYLCQLNKIKSSRIVCKL